jgi:hypothetical protein
MGITVVIGGLMRFDGVDAADRACGVSASRTVSKTGSGRSLRRILTNGGADSSEPVASKPAPAE